MNKQIRNRFLLIIGITLIGILFSIPAHTIKNVFGDNVLTEKLAEHRIVLGLDLAGGTELDYKIDLSDAIAQNNDDDPQNDVNLNTIAESVRDALEARVNPAGIGEIVVKRSQVEDQEHIIIQMPPSSNVERAKQDAEKDNRLEFFEETPQLLPNKKTEIATHMVDLTNENWETKTSQILSSDKQASFESFGPYFKDEVLNIGLAEKLENAEAGTIIPEIIETQTEAKTTINEDGGIEIVEFPEEILAIVYVKEKETETREKNIPAIAEARHILIGYPGATGVAEDIPYSSQEEAKAKAEELLLELQTNGVENFETLAKENSTEPGVEESGGNLGEFGPNDMVEPFSNAVFGDDSVGLMSEIIETEFGYHVIEVLSKTEETIETREENKYTYDMLYWKTNDFIWTLTDLSGTHLENATVSYNQWGDYFVDLLFNAEGGKLFGEITGRVAAKTCNQGPCRLGVKVGGVWITQPTVREQINGRTAQISGNFNAESAKQLANDLNLGAIDAPVILSGQMSITPEVGKDQLQKSLKAGLYGFIATMIFMIFMYKTAGFIAVISLSIYALLFIVILKTWPESFGGPIVLTLSGIAGVVLSLGLAVDGNILIFERVKEELKQGKSLKKSIDLGFERAWTAIRDSNLTTLLTCMILFLLGSSIIKGFAITLIVGTLLSMFTAINITRNLLRFFLSLPVFKNINIFGTQEKNKQ